MVAQYVVISTQDSNWRRPAHVCYAPVEAIVADETLPVLKHLLNQRPGNLSSGTRFVKAEVSYEKGLTGSATRRMASSKSLHSLRALA